MQADPYQEDVFARILVNYVPMTSLHEAVGLVLCPGGVTSPRQYIAELSPNAVGDPLEQYKAVAADAVQKGLQLDLAKALIRLMPGEPVLHKILNGYEPIGANGFPITSSLQTIRNRVEPFLKSGQFIDFLSAIRHRVCAIYIDRRFKGSGFLVGPDLVMTAYHVVDSLLQFRPPRSGEQGEGALNMIEEAQPGTGDRLAFVFDYWVPIAGFDPWSPPDDVSVVKASGAWLEWRSPKHGDDGVRHVFGAPPDVTRCFDCAVVRLSTPIGAKATAAGGGRIRGWVSLKDLQAAPSPGEVIAIVQHPGGGPQVWDKGEAVQSGPGQTGGTRIWYRTEASGGSSGSPCFLADTGLIGFHNAGYPTSPDQQAVTAECNQGVLLKPAAPLIPAGLVGAAPSREMALWSVSDDPAKPRPLLGRMRLRDAILDLSAVDTGQRIIVVEDRPGSTGRTGRSFSTEILKAIVRDRRASALVLNAGELAGLAPDAVLFNIASQLGFAPDRATIPPPPTEERQIARWLATDLPQWFGDLCEAHARSLGALTQGDAPGPIEAVAGEARGLREPIWIAIDDLHRYPVEGRMRECLAGLVGTTDLEANVSPGLRGLRWLFIGHVPDFIRESSVSYVHEEIATADIGVDEFAEWMSAAFLSRGDWDGYKRDTAVMLYDFMMNTVPALEPDSPNRDLETLAASALAALKSALAVRKRSL
ncbi:MAG TPA: serine protease [Microvirga sp.]|jgi:hypothetical protein|nr:serine protease [Microvirga sp.]